MHPNEPALVFRAESGTLLPTRAYDRECNIAMTLGAKHCRALHAQVLRQTSNL